MTGSEFLSAYPAKLMEYALAVGYLLLFVPFWRYLQGGRAAEAAAPARAPHAGAEATGAQWFTVPAGVLLHPGHTWARPCADGLVEVGLDDFAARLLGPVDGFTLPSRGSAVGQGMPALEAFEGGRKVGLLSPVDGTVAEVNMSGGAWLRDPYAGGWLFKVKPARLEANRRQLMEGEPARLWLQQAEASLAERLSPAADGGTLQDGGTPVHGIARELDPEHWDELCREYFRS